MTDRESQKSPPAAPDLRALAQDWITLWQSELSALTVDREAQETWQAMLALWAGAATAMLAAVPPAGVHGHAYDPAARRTSADAAPGSPPPSAPPDNGDAAIDRLTRHIHELEARLAKLERSGGRDDPRRPGARRGG